MKMKAFIYASNMLWGFSYNSITFRECLFQNISLKSEYKLQLVKPQYSYSPVENNWASLLHTT